jgi:melanoma-associated antigen
VEEESDDDAPRQSPSSEDNDGDVTMSDAGPESPNALIKQLVRYALACEFSRTPIRRDGIREKGMRLASRSARD